jgi:hypothetical protein
MKAAIIEAKEPIQNEIPIVYASHYDQSRIQHIIGKGKVWITLSSISVTQYDRAQATSNSIFYCGVDCTRLRNFKECLHLIVYKI